MFKCRDQQLREKTGRFRKARRVGSILKSFTVKKAFLLAILALSINAYAQNGHNYLQPQLIQHSISSDLDKMKGDEGRIPDIFTGEKQGKTDKYSCLGCNFPKNYLSMSE